MKETAVEVCEQFVSIDWKSEVAVMVWKIRVYESTHEGCEISMCAYRYIPLIY